MAWTQDDLDALKQARAAGVKRVKYSDGSEVEYASFSDMKALQAEMENELSPAAKPYRAFRGSPRSGY